MPTLYKLITAVLAVTGCASLVVTGELNPAMTVSGVALFPGYYRFVTGKRHARGWVIGILSLLTLGVFLLDSVSSGDVFLAVAHLTVAFQAIKSFDLKEPWDNLQVYFMSLLQLIIASELTHSLAFGVIFMVFMVLLVSAMILSHFLKEGHAGNVHIRKPVLAISFLTLIMTAVFFIVVPRTPYKFFGKSHLRGIKASGFSERMDFGSFGEVKLDHTVVMRVEMERDGLMPLYWRGITLNYFDGRSWRNTLQDRHRIMKTGNEYVMAAYEKKSVLIQQIYLEPLDSDIIFGLPVMKGIALDSRMLLADGAGTVFFPRKYSARVNYTVYSISGEGMTGEEDARYLQLPENTAKIIGLAGKIAADAKTAVEKARVIEKYLKNNYTYSLSVPPPAGNVSPIEHFLFAAKKGYCEHYATSMVLMLRGLGIHSRIVNGFYGGERNEFGGYLIVRQSDAHSWVEALIDGTWTRFDPTPAVSVEYPRAAFLLLDSLKMKWARYVVGFSAADQRSIFDHLTSYRLSKDGVPELRGLKTAFRILFLITLVMAGAYLITRMFSLKKPGLATVRYLDVRKALKRKGAALTASATPADLKKALIRMGVDGAAQGFIALYEEHRFGGREMTAARKREYERLFTEVKKKLAE